MTQRLLRNYEVSIWSLQDEFITVLKLADLENKGQTSEPLMTLNTDGTQELSFSIPMYIYQQDKRIENPIWYNTRNGNIIINMRKIKVIFNKGKEKEKVYDFLITQVTERHEQDQLYCDVTCEGLAFHELGQVGYKIELSSEVCLEEDYNAFIDGGESIQPTLQYWLNQFLKPYPDNPALVNSHEWYYIIRMNWDYYSNSDQRESNKIYEEPYVASWNITSEDNKVVPRVIEEYKEKARLIDLNESNRYNLTQDLAKAFGVFCKYEYIYDSNYHIIGRTVVFYNSFLQEEEGYLALTYPYNTDSISRTVDSTNLVTKMFIQSVDNSSSPTTYTTIMTSEANPMLEDYLFNFDYLKQIGSLTQEQQDAIEDYRVKIRTYNQAVLPLEHIIESCETRLPKAQAGMTVANNAIQLDKERLNDEHALFNNLDKQDGNEDGLVSLNGVTAKTGILIEDTKNSSTSNTKLYYLRITEKGVVPSTIHIYTNITFKETDPDKRLSDEISTGWVCNYDEFGNLVQLSGIRKPEDMTSNIVYITYDYNPSLYHENVIKTWENRLAKDTQDYEDYEKEVQELEQKIKDTQEEKNKILQQKRDLIADFELLMGPALREGYWQPENYNDYGDKFFDSFNLDKNATHSQNGKSGFTTLFWDSELFDGEQKIYYEIGADQEKEYYPCLDLSECIDSLTAEQIKNLSLLFYDYSSYETRPIRTIRSFSLGSQCQLGFCTVADSHLIKPILIITGAAAMSTDMINIMRSNNSDFHLGTLKPPSLENNQLELTEEVYVPHEQLVGKWLPKKTTDELTIYYPRIKINSLYLKHSEDQLALKYNGKQLLEFEDYDVFSRDDAYYILPKPRALIENGGFTGQFDFMFTLSNADTAIYLDAIEVMKENAFPKVSYEVNLMAVNEKFIYHTYDALAHIININDVDLKLKNVRGYISEVSLNLDRPWEDTITVQNYKNKFEDLFSTIVAQTAAMQKNEYTIGMAANLFLPGGELSGEVIQNSLQRVDLNYSFNNGKLTIDEENGIWGTSDNGVVAFRGGGIFTATEQDENNNWLWNTGITPEGINASLITTGQLDTNNIRIFAGDNIKLQLNATGLYAYKSYLDDNKLLTAATQNDDIANQLSKNNMGGIDTSQYVVFNEHGLYLRVEPDAQVLQQTDVTEQLRDLDETIDRVEISWDGLVLRNWNNEEVFFADADTGDLHITGTLTADSGSQIAGWYTNENAFYRENANFGAKNGLYFGTQGLSINDIFKLSVDNGNFNSLLFYDAARDINLLEFGQDDNGNYQLQLQNVVLGDTIIDDIVSIVPKNVFVAATKGQLEAFTDVPFGSLGTVYEYNPETSSTSYTHITNDDTNLNVHKRLSPMPRNGSPDYHTRWYDNGGGHLDLSVTYLNISQDSLNNGYTRAGYGRKNPNDSYQYPRSASTILKFDRGDNTADQPAGTSLTLNFHYRAADGNLCAEAPTGSDNTAKKTLTITLYQVKDISESAYKQIGSTTVTLTGSIDSDTLATAVITTKSAITYQYLYIVITNNDRDSLSLKMIKVAGDTNFPQLSVPVAGEDHRGLYIYLKNRDNDPQWYELLTPDIPMSNTP